MITISLLILLVSFITYRIAFYSPENKAKRKEDVYDLPDTEASRKGKAEMKRMIDELKSMPAQEVWITAFDGTKLYGRYYHICDEAPLQIQFHGYRGTAYRDFCGGNKLARKMGFNTLLVDQRAHGQSAGHTITFGVNESKDCLSWINYAVERFGKEKPIYLAGVSMGAATVLTAAGRQLPESVKGVIADCPFSSPEDVIKKFVEKMGYPPKLVFPFLALGVRIFGKTNIKSASPQTAVASASVPMLILHGEADSLVPCEMSRALYEKNPQYVQLVTFPNADHGMSYMSDPMRYEQAVQDFVEKCKKMGDRGDEKSL